jgi:hypothetical protein
MLFTVNGVSLAYHATPKCGCTSVKAMILESLGETVAGSEDEAILEIHKSIGSPPFRKFKADFRFCVVRDPVERFVSGYSNRVLHFGDTPEVDFDEFVEKFSYYYRKFPRIKHHFLPQIFFIGKRPEYFTNIFWISEMEEVREFLSSISKKEIGLGPRQSGGSDRKPVPNEEQIQFIRDFYKQDLIFLEKMRRLDLGEGFAERGLVGRFIDRFWPSNGGQ